MKKPNIEKPNIFTNCILVQSISSCVGKYAKNTHDTSQAVSSANCLPVTLFFLEKMKVKHN